MKFCQETAINFPSFMNKLQKTLRALNVLIKKPYLLNLVLDENDQWKTKVEKRYPNQLVPQQISLHQLLGNIDDTISPYLFLDGGSLPTDLLLLRGLARKFPECSYFEIGTWKGESVANVAPVAGHCITMDLPDIEKRALGMTETYISQHAELSKGISNVQHLKANSFTYDFSSAGRKFDLIFIDGDHHFASVKNDTGKILEHLVHENSIVVWHDVAFNPERIRYEVYSAILEGLPAGMHERLYHVTNTLCAVLLPKSILTTKTDRLTFELRIRSL